MMAGSSSNDCSSFEDEGAIKEEDGSSTPVGGATDTVEEASCIKKSREDAPDGAAANGNTNSLNTMCREMITRCVEISRHQYPLWGEGYPINMQRAKRGASLWGVVTLRLG
jgi:hypothetical protein